MDRRINEIKTDIYIALQGGIEATKGRLFSGKTSHFLQLKPVCL